MGCLPGWWLQQTECYTMGKSKRLACLPLDASQQVCQRLLVSQRPHPAIPAPTPSGEDLHKVLWLKSRNSEVWLERRKLLQR